MKKARIISELNFKRVPVGVKRVLMFLLVALIPISSIAVLGYIGARSTLVKRITVAMHEINTARANDMRELFRLRYEQADDLAWHKLVRQLSPDGMNHSTVIEAIQSHLEEALADMKLDVTSGYRQVDRKTAIEAISVANTAGLIIADSSFTRLGKTIPDEMLNRVQNYGAAYGGLESDPDADKRYLVFYKEIANWETRGFSGVLVLRVSSVILDEVTGIRTSLGETGESYLVDKENHLVTPSRHLEKNPSKPRKVSNDAILKAFKGQETQGRYKNFRNVQVIGSVKPLKEMNWVLVTEIEVGEALAPVLSVRNRTFAIAILFILIVVLLAWSISHSLAKLILAIRDASREIGSGNLDSRVPVSGKDEIGELAQAFNEMAENLAESRRAEHKSRTEIERAKVKLEEQKKDLESVNRELDSFVYTASHDLRAPLRGVTSFADFLEKHYSSRLDQKGKHYVDRIRRGISLMSNQLDDLLSLSRISRIKNPYEDVNMDELVSAIREKLHFDIDKNKIQFKIAKDLPTMKCDRIKMTELVQNLVTNAIKFSSKNIAEKRGRPEVRIGYEQKNGFHEFYVKDNGIGIDPKHHDQVFGIFKRLHKSEEYEGTGAGLSIVKKVIEDHGGKVWIDSALGKGTSFYFTVPKNLKSEKAIQHG